MAKVVCKEVAHVGTKSGRVTTVAGRVYDSSDAVVKAVPALFVPIDEWVERFTVEKTTAAPGEARDVKKPAKTPKKAKASDG